MHLKKIGAALAIVAVIGAGIYYLATLPPCSDLFRNISDEALCAGRTADTMPGSDIDYYADMDYGLSKDAAEVGRRLREYIPGISDDDAVDAFVRGRNNWIVWTAGNDRLWDELSRVSFGNLDFLKTISNHPSLRFSRDNRWSYFGLVNEPCYEKASGPRADRYGLWLDNWTTDSPQYTDCGEADPFENEELYPGVEYGARGENIEAGSYYGYGTGIVGLRLFPNPDFDEEAEEAWDPVAYYNDPGYYNREDLVKPYRVGMSCGFCHVGPSPTNPPADFEAPQWANLNSNPGAQYFWIDRIFMWNGDNSNYIYQLFHTSRPGALDTSLVSTDYINNPRTMNAIYNLGARVEIATKLGKEELAGGSLNNRQFNDLPAVPADRPLTQFYEEPDTVLTPRVLKDGADSVGALGALNRVYINIGLFSEDWLTHFRALIGGKRITPIEIEQAREYSTYWNANEVQTPDVGLFFLASARPDNLSDANDPANNESGTDFIAADESQLEQGEVVFAETCARCHSSKLPEQTFDHFPDRGCVNSRYLDCWNEYWEWSKTDDFKNQMRAIVQQDDFRENNFLSTELRVPVTLLETNACSPLATNAIAGNIWDNFSSETYKDLPSVGSLTVQQPYSGETWEYELPGGGRGYTRPASLVSLWTSAPYLLNNSLGEFRYEGTISARMDSFNNSIEQLLWPERRDGNFTVITKSGDTHPGIIDRTTEPSYLRIDQGYLPAFVRRSYGFLSWVAPWLFPMNDGNDEFTGLQIGPIPEGTPINLISNIDMEKRGELLNLLPDLIRDLKALPTDREPSREEGEAIFRNLLDPLIAVSKCPDYVVNKGHYFGTDYFDQEEGLSDDDKRALIEYLKTL